MTLKMVKIPLIALGIVAALFLGVYFGGSNLLPNIAGAPQESTNVSQQSGVLVGGKLPISICRISPAHVGN